jgi:hypothetical protein
MAVSGFPVGIALGEPGALLGQLMVRDAVAVIVVRLTGSRAVTSSKPEPSTGGIHDMEKTVLKSRNITSTPFCTISQLY